MILGLDIIVPNEIAMATLKRFGVSIIGDVALSAAGNFANLEDPDGNEIYLWEKTGSAVQETMLAGVVAQ